MIAIWQTTLGSKLRVQFDDPQHGWMTISIRSDASLVTLTVSSVVYHTLDELVEGLHALATGDCSRCVRIMEEPTVCELQFKRESVPIGLRVCRRTSRDHCQTLFETESSFSEICVPFWRALRNLESRFSAEEFSRRWGRPLPAVRDGKADRNPETPTVLAASAISACDVIYFAKCTRTDMVVAP